MKKIFFLFTVCLLSLLQTTQAANISVTADITSSTTWTKNNVYTIVGYRYVKSGATLTIEAGTLIYGDKVSKGTLIISKTGHIHAVGTQCQPIVFTSNQPVGSKAAGDWGGVIILGNAPTNNPGGTQTIEGGIGNGLGDDQFGGTNSADNSGEFEYVRIEYPGIAFLPNNEINGLTCGGVGSGTTIDHIMVAYSGDDGYEFFGGNVNCKYLISLASVDDDFDTDNGFSGKLQFCVSLRDPNIADISGSKAFESDNDATGSTNSPNTGVLFSNMTCVGPQSTTGGACNSLFIGGAHIRRNSNMSLYNSIVIGFPIGFKLDGTLCENNATANTLQWQNNFISGCSNLFALNSGSGFNFNSYYNAQGGNFTLSNPNDVLLTSPFTISSPNFLPTPTSPVLFNGSFTNSRLQNAFFTPVTYCGAFDGTNDWTKGWSNWTPQSTDYSVYTSGINYSPNITGVTSWGSGCATGTGILQAIVTGGVAPLTYSWDRGTTLNVGTSAAIYNCATTTSTIKYALHVTSTGGCHDDSTGITVKSQIAVPTNTSISTMCGPTAGTAQITITWTGQQAVCACGWYEVYYKQGTYVSSYVNVGNATTYTFTGLTPNVTCYTYVRWHCGVGTHASSWRSKSKKTANGCRFEDDNTNGEVISSIDIYPNPASSNVSLAYNFQEGGNANISIVNMMGQVVYTNVSENLGSDEININTNDFTNGIYFVTISQNGEKVTSKLVINK